MEPVLLVRYAEIHLKGLNRPYFERKLVSEIERALASHNIRIVREQGRIFVFGLPNSVLNEAAERLTYVFGIHSVSPAYATEKDMDSIISVAVSTMADALTYHAADGVTFKVFARRADKRFPVRSQEICEILGNRLLDAFPTLRVDVHNPVIRLGAEVRQQQAFVYAWELMGVGGMPVGCNGHAMLLISGGIDSPVAGYMVAKRGVRLSAVHFYSFPYTSERARDKVVSLVHILSRYAGPMRLFLVPFTDIQLAIYEKCPKTETTILMRRLMMKIAETIALVEGAQCLVTGEAIGQVASQTIESLTVTEDAVTLPVFRPLIGFDKEEIIERCKAMGAFETAILPFEDCCTVFVPQHPVTKPQIDRIRQSEALVDFGPLIQKALNGMQTIDT